MSPWWAISACWRMLPPLLECYGSTGSRIPASLPGVPMPEAIDALFIPFYSNIDRWHNDSDRDYEYPSLARNRAMLEALSDERFMKDEVDLVMDGKLYDFSRFLSW